MLYSWLLRRGQEVESEMGSHGTACVLVSFDGGSEMVAWLLVQMTVGSD